MYPFSSRALNSSWVVSLWLSVIVVVNRSNVIPSRSHASRNVAWYFSTSCAGGMPSASACIVMGAPWESLPETISTSLPRRRW